MLERRIEEAALNSWPARQQLLFDGWVIRCDQGYTKRANSVTPVYTSLLPVQEKIRFCEQFYTEKHLPMVFRLPSFLAGIDTLDHLLAQREYQHLDLSLVMSRELAPGATTLDPALRSVSLATWLPVSWQFNQIPVEKQQAHRAILERITPKPLFAVLYQEGIPVACGLGALENKVFGLFGIVTSPTQRKQGHSTRLIAAMLTWATQHGAEHAYLQVLNNNLVACHIYEQFGFHELYRYWYRVQPASHA